MAIVDTDLLALQEARFALEGATCAQVKLEELSAHELKQTLLVLRKELTNRLAPIVSHAVMLSDYSTQADDTELAQWVLDDVYDNIMGYPYAGSLVDGERNASYELTLSRGVAITFLPDWISIPTLLCEIGFAIWSKSALIVCASPRVLPAVSECIELVKDALATVGYPQDAITCLSTYAPEAEAWLAQQVEVSTIVTSRERLDSKLDCALRCRNLDDVRIYRCSLGNNPVFIEKTADLDAVVREVMLGKSYCTGLLPGAEQSLVVESSIADTLRTKLKAAGAAFLSSEEAERLTALMYSPSGEPYLELAGKSASDLAHRAGVVIPPNTKVLVIEHPYVSAKDPMTRAKFAPILCFYVEDDWQNACEKCIELILGEGAGNVLSIFSNDAEVVKLFAEKKPVGRLIVNASCALGAMGAHTNLPKTLLLTSWQDAGQAGPGVDVASFTRTRLIAFSLDSNN